MACKFYHNNIFFYVICVNNVNVLLTKNIYDSDSDYYCTMHKKIFQPSNPCGALILKLSPPSGRNSGWTSDIVQLKVVIVRSKI